ncbi:hypothetical protein N665_0039s0125 [Sinapis alba]|nr:hypothetical protein N665_0039s0125 [Sinapis alba]
MRCYNNYSSLVLLSLLLLLLDSKVVSLSSSCQTSCGNIKIQFPFGIEKGCYLDDWYQIECRNATFPFLFKLDMEVVNISVPGDEERFYSPTTFGSIRLKIPITSVGCSGDGEKSEMVLNLKDSPFFVGTGNSIVGVGCNSKALLTNIEPIMMGCELNCTAPSSKEMPSSESIPFLDKTGCSDDKLPYTTNTLGCTITEGEEERSCNGNGCCLSSLPNDPQQMIGVRIESSDHGNFHWAATTREFNKAVFESTRNSISCVCYNITISGTNYANCGCNEGYTGNPYLSNGCKDVNECVAFNPCSNCVNFPGNYHCVGNNTGKIMIGVGTALGTLALVGGIWFLRKFIKKTRMTRRKRKFFKRNGGLLLQQQLNTNKGNIEKTRIFTSRELEKATENFSENRILGQGGQGTVYKGMLVDGKTVAVKKSKVVDEDKLEEFINEVVILSQVNHRHVVKLLGCCLETEVPVLVYEFIPNGNLFQHIHEESDDYTMIWGVRLRIAVDIAGALSYLHSSASSPIYHRDVKSTNILLDEKYRAKVSDFGTSRSVTVDHTHWTTVISGTVGYVDPEYYGSSQYTDKSDVYSFGVVLVELITGEKPVITLSSSQEIKGLADHFRAAMKDNKFFDIMDARIKDACKPEQVMAVANLARRCLNSKGKKRPYMREVFTELEKISSSQEVKVENDNGDDEEEEGMNMIEIADSCTIGVTAPASTIVPSSSLSDVETLFPRPTW